MSDTDVHYISVFFAVPVHGQLVVSSFDTWTGKSIEEMWKTLAEYIEVDIQWWCEDRKLEHDFEALKKPTFFRILKEGKLESLIQKEDYEAIRTDEEKRKDPFAFFGGEPTPEMLDKVTERLRDVFQDPKYPSLKLP